MKKTIQLNGIDPMIFAGVNDQNIKIIDTNFDSNIVLCEQNCNPDTTSIRQVEHLPIPPHALK